MKLTVTIETDVIDMKVGSGALITALKGAHRRILVGVDKFYSEGMRSGTFSGKHAVTGEMVGGRVTLSWKFEGLPEGLIIIEGSGTEQ